MTIRAGDRVIHQGLDCRVLAVTYRDGGLCRLARPDGSVLEDVRLSAREPVPAQRRAVNSGEW